MKNSLAPLIVESERVLAEAVKHFGLTIPTEKIVVTIQSKGKKKALGWFGPEHWGISDKTVHEINLSAEWLKLHNMGETLLHELAHAENEHLGVQDVSGRVHNKHFKKMAERVGLEVKEREPAIGFGRTDLAPAGTEFLEKIAFNRELFALARVEGGPKVKPGSRLLKCECPECGYTVRVTRKWLDVGSPMCPCGTTMGET